MQKLVIKHNQSLVDVSVQAFGTLEAIMELADANDISITDELIEGNELDSSSFETSATNILAYYQKYQIKPVTALSEADFALVAIESCNLCNCFK